MSAISGCPSWAGLLLFAVMLSFGHPYASERASLQTEWLTRTWEAEDGLPENSATAMAQTKDGYLWFGTFNGLVRFDGTKFKVFNPQNSPGLPSGGIVNLHLDRGGRLWVSTLEGIVVQEGNKWRNWGTKEQLVRTFTERPNGDLLLTMFDGAVFEFRDGKFERLPDPPGEKKFGYFGSVDDKGIWWVVQHGFVGHWSGSNWIRRISIPKMASSETGCAQARDGGLWLLLGKELRKYKDGAEVARFAVPEVAGSIWTLFEDRSGTIWISTADNGLFQVSPGAPVRNWTITSGLPAQGVRFVYEDRESNLWVGTSGGGLTRLRPKYFRSFGRDSGLSELVIHSVSAARGGGAWIGSYGKGLFRLRDGEIRNTPIVGARPASSFVQSVLEDRSGRLWVGTFGGGLYRLNHDKTDVFESDVTAGSNVIALYESPRGPIWVSGGSGVARFDGDKFIAFTERENAPRNIRCFVEDRKGSVWMSNGEEVFRFDEGTFRKVQENETAIRGVSCLKEGSEGTIWLGSLDRGLLAWREGALPALATVNVRDGFPLQNVFGIEADQQGCFWITSNRGIVRVLESQLLAVLSGKKSPVECQFFDLTDGLPTIQCASGFQPVVSAGQKGDIWIATVKGITGIDSASYHPKGRAPQTRIQELGYSTKDQASSRPGAVRVLEPFDTPVRIPAGSHGLEFRYSALNFSAPEKVRYQVKLGSVSNMGEWEDAENRTEMIYQSLVPGDYTFSVRAWTGDGITDETEATLAFTVLPFFWETSGFRMVAATMLVALGWLGARYRIRSAETLQQTEKRMALAADLAHLGMWQWEIPQDRVWLTRTTRETFQFPLDTVGAQAFLERIRSLDRERVNDAFEHAMSFGASHLTFRLRPPDGPTRWITASVLVDFDRHQKPIRMIGVCMDVTERRNAEESARELSGRLIHAQEDERRRIARELHDDLNQRLAVLSVEIALLRQANDAAEKREQRLNDVGEQIKELASEVHKISYRLHPAKLDQLGLVAASRSFCRELEQQTGIKVEFVHADVPRKLPEDVALCVYRVMQEALQNMIRHSRSPEAKVHLQFHGGDLSMLISDNGKGFDLDVVRRKGGLGLISMNERVRLVNGTFKIESDVGSGTRITVKVPLALNPAHRLERQPDLGI